MTVKKLFQQRDSTVVVGTVDGLVSIRRREEDATPSQSQKKKVAYRNVGDFLPSASLAQNTIIGTGGKLIVPHVPKVSICYGILKKQ